MDKDKERLLFDALKNGSNTAFEEVYIENREKFFNFSKNYGLSKEDRSDIYQNVFISFYENIQNGKLKKLTSSISTYLISIGKYKIFELLRKNRKSSDNESLIDNLKNIDQEIEFFDLEIIELSLEEERLKTSFDLLGKKCQRILSLFYYNGYTIKEIQNEGNYNSENVVKSQKSRCLKRLKELFHNPPE